MAAYLIVYREGPVRDAEEMGRYSAKTRQMAAGDWKLLPRVIYGAVHPLEGHAPDGVILLEFPSVEDAKAWYNSPAYQDALPHRQKAADFRAIIVEGV